jgi:hypothetical protein
MILLCSFSTRTRWCEKRMTHRVSGPVRFWIFLKFLKFKTFIQIFWPLFRYIHCPNTTCHVSPNSTWNSGLSTNNKSFHYVLWDIWNIQKVAFSKAAVGGIGHKAASSLSCCKGHRYPQETRVSVWLTDSPHQPGGYCGGLNPKGSECPARPVVGIMYKVHTGQEICFEGTRNDAESACLKFIKGRINCGLFAWFCRHARYVRREWCVDLALLHQWYNTGIQLSSSVQTRRIITVMRVVKGFTKVCKQEASHRAYVKICVCLWWSTTQPEANYLPKEPHLDPNATSDCKYRASV